MEGEKGGGGAMATAKATAAMDGATTMAMKGTSGTQWQHQQWIA